ncbi:MAG: hypothetical protein WCL27_16070 [Betaproteobacteria bacterium]
MADFFSLGVGVFVGLTEILGLVTSAPEVTGAFSFSAAFGVAYEGVERKLKMLAITKISVLLIFIFMFTTLSQILMCAEI